MNGWTFLLESLDSLFLVAWLIVVIPLLRKALAVSGKPATAADESGR